MKTATFKEWDLDKLEESFGLKQVWQSDLLTQWENNNEEVTEFEKQTLLNLQEPLIWGGRAWNEFELENKFISPVIMTAKIDNRKIGYFLKRPLSSVVGDYQLSGIVDGMIATGFRNPHIPYFYLHQYKYNTENQGCPDGQALAAMLVGREINNNKLPIYGIAIIGLSWSFLVLQDNHYCISKSYCADGDDIFKIFKMLKSLKQIINTELLNQ